MLRRPTIWTIGHSTRPIDEFIDCLRAHEIRLLVDVRTIPRSRHNPQFNTDRLAESLKDTDLSSLHIPTLGGPSKGSEGFDQSRVAQCQFSRLCRLYADGIILECTGRINDAKSARPNRDHVRRGCPVALPPLADRRCAGHAWLGGQAYLFASQGRRTSVDAVRDHRQSDTRLSSTNRPL